jgi:hypothetical protein
MSETVPIACTLGAGDFQQRLAWIADLNQRRLKRHARTDLTLTLVYDRAARRDVARLAAQERECCAFLTFELADSAEGAVLTITAPEDAREAVDTLFAGFTSGKAPTACGCC